jgi:hypothetical protein
MNGPGGDEHFTPEAVVAAITLAAKIHAANLDLPKLDPLPRMRIEHGRVMHAVKVRGTGTDIGYESKCRRGSGIAGVSATYPRAQGPVSWWTAERLWYPDCRHCPVDES